MDLTKLEHSWHATFDQKGRFAAPGWLLSVWSALEKVHGFDAVRHSSNSIHTQNMLSQPGAMQSYLQKTHHSQWKRFQWCLVDSSSPTLSPPTMLWYRLLHGQHTACIGFRGVRLGQVCDKKLVHCTLNIFPNMLGFVVRPQNPFFSGLDCRQRPQRNLITAWQWVGVGSKRFSKQSFLLNWIDDLPAFTNVSKPFVDDPVLERQSSCMKKEHGSAGTAADGFHGDEFTQKWRNLSGCAAIQFSRSPSSTPPSTYTYGVGSKRFSKQFFLLNWIDDLPAFTNVSKPFVDDPVLERQSSCMKKEHGSAGTAADGFHRNDIRIRYTNIAYLSESWLYLNIYIHIFQIDWTVRW